MESGEERDGAGKEGGELLRGSHYPHPRSGPLDSRAPAGLFNPQRVALNRGSAARWAQRKRGREEPRKGEGGTHLEETGQGARGPKGSGNGFFLESLGVSWQPARTLSGRTRGRDPEPHQLLTSGGGQMPLLQLRTRLGAQCLGGAHTRGARVPRAPALGTSLRAASPRPDCPCARLPGPIGTSPGAGNPLDDTGPRSEPGKKWTYRVDTCIYTPPRLHPELGAGAPFPSPPPRSNFTHT